jgi:hypothetical protein
MTSPQLYRSHELAIVASETDQILSFRADRRLAPFRSNVATRSTTTIDESPRNMYNRLPQNPKKPPSTSLNITGNTPGSPTTATQTSRHSTIETHYGTQAKATATVESEVIYVGITDTVKTKPIDETTAEKNEEAQLVITPEPEQRGNDETVVAANESDVDAETITELERVPIDQSEPEPTDTALLPTVLEPTLAACTTTDTEKPSKRTWVLLLTQRRHHKRE